MTPEKVPAMTPEEALPQAAFGPDKILGPEHAEHVRGVVIHALRRHVGLGHRARGRSADAAAEALTGKQMRPVVSCAQVQADTSVQERPNDTDDTDACLDRRHIAEEDGDILPPACPTHGGPLEVSR